VFAVHPLTILVTAGLVWMVVMSPRRRAACLLLFSIVLTIYLYSCWSTWHLGFSYGARWSSDLLVIWSIGLALLIKKTSPRKPWRWVYVLLPLAVWSVWRSVSVM